MKSSFLITIQKTVRTEKVKSFLISLIVISPLLITAIILKVIQPLFSQLLLLFTGWLVWTFIEYFNHRFRMHGKSKKERVRGYEMHMNHHHHPTDIRITAVQRVLLLTGNIGLIVWCMVIPGWLILFTGLYWGFVFYGFMHVILHQRWSAKLFPKLQQFHIHHHCKYPNRCFGVSVTWWDMLLNTAPPKEASISPKIVEFYFGNKSVHP